MHDHTKQQLENVRTKIFAVIDGGAGSEEVEEAVLQALKSQAEMIRAEMPDAIIGGPKTTERSLYLLGYNDHYLKTKDKLDNLINSFE